MQIIFKKFAIIKKGCIFVLSNNKNNKKTMSNVPHIFKTDCGNYVAIEGDFVNIYYNFSDFMKLVNKLNDEQLMGYPDTFEFLRDQDRYDVLCEGRDFYNLKPAKIEIL